MFLLLILGLVFSVLLTAMSLSFRSLSLSHLRYWARKGDETSKKLYLIKARGSSALLTIELLRSLTISGTLVLLTLQLWGVLAWLIGAVVLFVAFIVLTELYLRPVGAWLLAATAPVVVSLTQLLKVITVPLGRLFDRFLEESPVVLTRSELVHMIGAVQVSDTDLSGEELRIVKHALTFGEKSVHDIMTPRSVIHSVRAEDVLSPILLDELHKSGHSRFPVIAADGEDVVGLLYIKDLLDVKAHTRVSDVMHKPVHYVNEDRELDHVLQAFIRTKQHLFLVVNSFAEVTGLVTIEDVIEQVLGKPIIDEFDRYDDMREVAEARAKVFRKQVKLAE